MFFKTLVETSQKSKTSVNYHSLKATQKLANAFICVIGVLFFFTNLRA